MQVDVEMAKGLSQHGRRLRAQGPRRILTRGRDSLTGAAPMKKIKLEVLKERARVVTRAALADHPPVPQELWERVVLGMQLAGDDWVFELYAAGERPQDAIVLTRVSANRLTGEVGPVEVFPAAWVDLPER
jgi:hypothetical protein